MEIPYHILKKYMNGGIVEIEDKRALRSLTDVNFVRLGTGVVEYPDGTIRLCETASATDLGKRAYRHR